MTSAFVQVSKTPEESDSCRKIEKNASEVFTQFLIKTFPEDMNAVQNLMLFNMVYLVCFVRPHVDSKFSTNRVLGLKVEDFWTFLLRFRT